MPDALPSAALTSSQSNITIRLHISGLSPTLCSVQDLTNRFTPYASISSISHWPPANDALGKPRNWAFVTLNGSRERIRKCINTLSGTVWKGSKVRIGEAKKDFKGQFGESVQMDGWGRLNEGSLKAPETSAGNEQVEAEDTQKKKRRKHSKRVASGREERRTSNGQVITEEDVKAGKVWGWKLTPAGHLIRPLQMRPPHPLPPASASMDPPATSSTLSASSSKSKRIRKSGEKKKTKAEPISRAKSQIIDPTRYGVSHLTGDMIHQADVDQNGESSPREIWICEEVEGQVGKVRWVKNGGAEVEEVQVSSKSVQKSEEYAQDVFQKASDADIGSNASSSSSSFAPVMDRETVESNEVLYARHSVQRVSSPLGDLGKLSDDEEEQDMANGTFHLSHYDPEDDDTFSEGYNEDAITATAATRPAVPSAEKITLEKEREIKVLEELFGPRHLAGQTRKENPLRTIQDRPQEDDEGDEGTWWKELKGHQHDRPNFPAATQLTNEPDSVEVKKAASTLEVEEDLPSAPLASSSSSHLPASVTISSQTPAEMLAVKGHTSPPSLVSKRAALLARMKTAASSSHASTTESHAAGSFQPVQRYEPASTGSELTVLDDDDDDDIMSTAPNLTQQVAPSTLETASSAIVAPLTAAPTEVEMGSLKDMFRPQEGGSGGPGAPFSLFGRGGMELGQDDLDDDFDFGFDFGENVEAEDNDEYGEERGNNVGPTLSGNQARRWGQPQGGTSGDAGHGGGDAAAAAAHPVPSTTTATGPIPLFFPDFRGSDRDPLRFLLRNNHSTSQVVKPFWRTESPQELEALWSSRKVELTQDYKRRHREAVKKKRRKVVGSRRAGGQMAVGGGVGPKGVGSEEFEGHAFSRE